jgi:dTDP-4-amino-4,6-dideoxygalactose transaminase
MRFLSAAGSNVFDREPGQETVSTTEVQSKYLTRMTNLQAGVGLRQLNRVETSNARLNENALLYNKELKDQKGVKTPSLTPGRTHTFLYYRLEVTGRKSLREKLIRKGVDTATDDMSDCTTLPPFRPYEGDLPVARNLPERILEIPNNPHLREKDILYISRCIRDAVK